MLCGTFRYGLAVSDLDERARGQWSVEGNQVRPVTLPTPRPPEIKPGTVERDPRTKLRITVTLPNGRLVGALISCGRAGSGGDAGGGGSGQARPGAAKGVPSTCTGMNIIVSGATITPLRKPICRSSRQTP